MGTTVRVASMRDDGQTFHDNRTPARRLHTSKTYNTAKCSPSRSSTSSKLSIVLDGRKVKVDV